jgi:NADH-quinone oxidoreductase subunit J
MELAVFIVCTAIVIGGALGVVLSSNPVHAALSLVGTLFGVAVLFIAQDAQFLAAVQVIVYAGAIVVLFLFVIMLLGVDELEDLSIEPLGGPRPAALIAGVVGLGLTLVVLLAAGSVVTGRPDTATAVQPDVANVTQLGHLLFSDYVFAFEATAILLTIAVVGAVVLARRMPRVEDLPASGAGAVAAPDEASQPS